MKAAEAARLERRLMLLEYADFRPRCPCGWPLDYNGGERCDECSDRLSNQQPPHPRNSRLDHDHRRKSDRERAELQAQLSEILARRKPKKRRPSNPNPKAKPQPIAALTREQIKQQARDFVNGPRASAKRCGVGTAGFGPCMKSTKDHGAWCSDGSRMWRRM